MKLLSMIVVAGALLAGCATPPPTPGGSKDANGVPAAQASRPPGNVGIGFGLGNWGGHGFGGVGVGLGF